MWARIWLIVLGLVWITSVGAKDIGGEYAVHGVGGDTCQLYLVAREAGGAQQVQYEIWLAGYFSAFNLIVSNTYSIMGKRGVDQFLDALDQYCEQRPDELFIEAITAVTMVVFEERQNLSPYVDRWPSLIEQLDKAKPPAQ